MEILIGNCKKHPISNKNPGICSICLRDRLLQLADTYNNNTTFHNTTVTNDRCLSFSSTSTSSLPSIYLSNPKLNNKKHVRHASSSDAVRSITYAIGDGSELKKSRSIATTTMVMSSGKKGSFWKKLMKVRGKEQVIGNSGNV